VTGGHEIPWLDELVENIRGIHDLILEHSGGSPGEHTERLYSSCARPFQSAFGGLLYETAVDQAGALLHGLITSHVFVDGNKRTASLATILFLISRDYIEDATELQIRMSGEVAVAAASGQLTADQITDWLRRIFGPEH